MKYLLVSIFIFFLLSCDDEYVIEEKPVVEDVKDMEGDQQYHNRDCEGLQINKDYIYSKGNDTYLWGGSDTLTHFKVSDWEFKECNLRYGLGREAFPALTQPKYVSIASVLDKYGDFDKCIVVYMAKEIKVYPYKVMINHEIINEIANGTPIMIAYCVLADLATVYERTYCDQTLTFALSGYTYYEEDVCKGLEAFVLWDRDTESLWWPLIDKGVSGFFKDAPLDKYNEGLHETLIWKEIKETYPEALVLESGQEMEVPINWPSLDTSSILCH